MKKIIKLSCFLFVSFAIFSCSKDDDSSPEIFTNTVSYDGASYMVEEGNIYDYGPSTIGFGYYNYVFKLEGKSSDNTPFELFIDLYSKGTESFKTGTFEFYNLEGSDEQPDYIFKSAEISVNNESEYIAESGTLVVNKNANTYSLSGQITLENDEVVTISYSGEFTINDVE